jgi:hypothetical protein
VTIANLPNAPWRFDVADGSARLRKLTWPGVRAAVPDFAAGHALAGIPRSASDQIDHGSTRPAFIDYLASPRFWFRVVSEVVERILFSVAAMVWLAVYPQAAGLTGIEHGAVFARQQLVPSFSPNADLAAMVYDQGVANYATSSGLESGIRSLPESESQFPH